MTTNVKFIRLLEGAVTPVYSSEEAAGADLCACLEKEVAIAPGQTFLVPTGLAMRIPKGLVGLVFARSGLATKCGLAPANKVGVIDSDYRGQIMVPLHNHSNETVTVTPGERIAQFVLVPYLTAEFEETDSLDDTARGTGGFGSTGSH